MKEVFKRGGDTFKVPLESIKPGPNVRTIFPDETIAILANSLVLEGQLENIKGYYDGEFFITTNGERRLRAALYANKNLGAEIEYLTAEIEDKKAVSGTELIFKQLTYGTMSEALSPMDQAKAYKTLTKDGITAPQIAKRCGCSDQHVRDLLTLLTLPEEIQGAVKAGQLGVSAAIRTAKAKDDAVTEAVEEKVRRGEKVRVKDVQDEPEPNGNLPKILSFDEIQSQILKAGGMKLQETSQRGQTKWEGVIMGLRIAAGLEELLK